MLMYMYSHVADHSNLHVVAVPGGPVEISRHFRVRACGHSVYFNSLLCYLSFSVWVQESQACFVGAFLLLHSQRWPDVPEPIFSVVQSCELGNKALSQPIIITLINCKLHFVWRAHLKNIANKLDRSLSPNQNLKLYSCTLICVVRRRSPRFHHIVPSSCVARLSSLPPSSKRPGWSPPTSQPSGVRYSCYQLSQCSISIISAGNFSRFAKNAFVTEL